MLDSEIFLDKISPMLVFFTTVLALGLVFVILTIGGLIDKSLRKKRRDLRDSIFWNLILRTFMEGYLPLSHQYLTEFKEGY